MLESISTGKTGVQFPGEPKMPQANTKQKTIAAPSHMRIRKIS
jgi:hypothetical protein